MNSNPNPIFKKGQVVYPKVGDVELSIQPKDRVEIVKVFPAGDPDSPTYSVNVSINGTITETVDEVRLASLL